MAKTSTQKRIKKQLDGGKEITTEMITELINDHIETKVHTLKLYKLYKGDTSTVPIFTREFEGEGKINSKLHNDFPSEIIDVKLGYMLGKPIKYNLDKNKYENELEFKEHINFISRLSILNNFVDIDTELAKIVSICGVAGREIFIDADGETRLVNLYPWETIFLTNVFGEVVYALRYFETIAEDNAVITNVEFFDKHAVTYFEGSEGSFSKVSENVHLFGQCPITKIVNNEEEIGDFERVLSEIDAYDRTMSDISSEIEQFRLAYMFFKGKEPTPEVIESAKQTGGFYVGETGEVGFITKNINDAVVEHHLDRLEANILRFSKSVNFTDTSFGGTITGVAMKYKLFALESKTAILETKYQAFLRNQFKIICNMLNLKNINLDYLDVFFEFTRNLPINKQEEIQANQMLVGLVSERTRLSMLSTLGVDDVEYELLQMQLDGEISDEYSKTETYNTNSTNTNTEVDVNE